MSPYNANKLILLGGAGISLAANWLYTLALMSVFIERYDPVRVAILMAVATSPAVLLGPIIAGLIDRADKKSLLFLLNIIQACVVLLLCLVQGLVTTYAVTFVLASLNVFVVPLIKAVMPTTTAKENLANLNSMFGMVYSVVGYVAAPMISALLISVLGAEMSFMVGSGLFFILSIMILGVSIPKKQEIRRTDETKKMGTPWEVRVILLSSKEVLRVIATNKILLSTFFAYGSASLALGVIHSVDISFFTQILGVKSGNYGVFVSISGIGVFLGSFFFGRRYWKWSPFQTFQSGLLFFSCATIVFCLNTNVCVAGMLIFMAGAGEGLFEVSTITVIHREARPDMMAGVFSLLESMAKGCELVAMVFSALVLPLIGVKYTLLAAGVIPLIFAAALLRNRYSKKSRSVQIRLNPPARSS